MKKKAASRKYLPIHSGIVEKLIEDLRIVIESFYHGSSNPADRIMLFWKVGKRTRERIGLIRSDRQRHELINRVSRELSTDFGDSFLRREILFMMDFSKVYVDSKRAAELAPYLTWRHFNHLTSISNPLKRHFYEEMCRAENWSPQVLKENIQNLLFEKTSMATGSSTASRILKTVKSKDAPPDEYIYRGTNTFDI